MPIGNVSRQRRESINDESEPQAPASLRYKQEGGIDYLEIEVDGRPLAHHFGGRLGAHPSSIAGVRSRVEFGPAASRAETVAQFLAERTSDLGSGPVAVVRERCGDVGCGAFTVRITRIGKLSTGLSTGFGLGRTRAGSGRVTA